MQLSSKQLLKFRALYPSNTDAVLRRRFGITQTQINSLVRKQALKKSKVAFVGETEMPRWSRTEVSVLRKHFSKLKTRDIAVSLGRSAPAVACKAAQLGLKKSARRLRHMGRENRNGI